MITRSLVVIGYRDGNPQQIHDWEDLTKPGIGVVYPDPKLQAVRDGTLMRFMAPVCFTPAGHIPIARPPANFSRVQANVITMDASGRQSMATFDRGTGDAIVTYENELLLQGKLDGQVPLYAVPPATLLIEGPAAIVDAYVARHRNRKLAEAFVDIFDRKKDNTF